MATIIINDEALEGKVGERLYHVARRNGAHMGFICDGAGTCQTCRCRVTAGEEHLSPPSEAERAWIPAGRLAEGQRLACQAIIRGDGQISLVSWPEELRRMVLTVTAPPPDADRIAALQTLLGTLARQAGDQLAHWPWNVLDALNRGGPVRFFYPFLDEARMLDHTIGVVKRMRSEDARQPAPRER